MDVDRSESAFRLLSRACKYELQCECSPNTLFQFSYICPLKLIHNCETNVYIFLYVAGAFLQSLKKKWVCGFSPGSPKSVGIFSCRLFIVQRELHGSLKFYKCFSFVNSTEVIICRILTWLNHCHLIYIRIV